MDGSVGVLMGDGAYDSADVYAAVEERNSDALVIVPPRAGAVASSQTSPTQRDGHIRNIAARGRRGWQAASGYNRRALGRGSDRPLQACHRQRPSISYRGG